MQVNIGGIWKTINALQCNIGGVWKTIKSGFCNIAGVWKQFYSKIFQIYTNGVSNYSSWFKSYSWDSGSGNYSWSNNGSYLYLKTSWTGESGYAAVKISLSSLLDVTNYSTLHVDLENVGLGGVYTGPATITISVGTTNNTYPDLGLAHAYYGTLSRQTVTLDISSITGNVYIMIMSDSSQFQGSNAYVYNIWLD
ncbi:hypothetical protein [Desulfitobacterium sp. AusDCA]|uniref:hypothetical protein n=1 Tax=Desulfitobacterium sp. AusDCA TaxID=3240383 RepID=UPI003DA6DACB